MHYMQQKSLGFDKEHIITLPYVTELNDKYDDIPGIDLFKKQSVQLLLIPV